MIFYLGFLILANLIMPFFIEDWDIDKFSAFWIVFCILMEAVSIRIELEKIQQRAFGDRKSS